MSFQVALTGLSAASTDLAVTANNIANSNTTGFKESRTSFADVYAVSSQGISTTTPGSGVRVAGIQQQFSQGSIDYTNNNLDLAISGNGFFIVSQDGSTEYTRAGAFAVDRDGYVVAPSDGARLQVYPPISGSNNFNTGDLTDLRLDGSAGAPQASSLIELGANFKADAAPPTVATFNPADPESYNNAISTTVYDSLGAAHTATLYIVKDGITPNTWASYLYVDGTAVGTPQPVTFNPDGSLATPIGGSAAYGTFTPTNGADPLNLTIDFSGSTQYGGSFSTNRLTQDGYASGQLSGIDIDRSGIVLARYSNGRSVPLGKIALADFPNPQGLQKQGDTRWAETFASGSPLRGEAGTSSLGLIQSGALEASNVDLTAELVRMIVSQRSFQANAQMISTMDQITQTVINIR
ncbi:MAG TPA: flagellar hook protein FlgE [Candidatus Acidoferrales bacterium]|nr:flagellar hook protein FlgE [Candidatus Acidoferrales bacterium]